jgi:hypothetical protein
MQVGYAAPHSQLKKERVHTAQESLGMSITSSSNVPLLKKVGLNY